MIQLRRSGRAATSANDCARATVDTAKRMARASTSVIIRGESGVGKELVARALHDEGPRRARAFVSVNCAALPEALMESELFGYEKGAFTGAAATKEGRIELAHRGTNVSRPADVPQLTREP